MTQFATFTPRPAAPRRALDLLALALVLLASAMLSPAGAGAQATTGAGWVKQSTGSMCKVPSTAKYGTMKVTVTTAAGTSNSYRFTVKR